MNILVIGGRGYVGSEICSELKRRKHKVYTCDRSEGERGHRKADVRDISTLKSALKGIKCVINLVGLTPIRKVSYEDYHDAHVKGAKNVVSACKKIGIKRLIHMSALGADSASNIAYIKTKGIGEKAVLNSGLNATVFCPSIIFDRENEFVRQAASTAWTRVFPDIPGKVQPVYRKNIARLYSLAVEGKILEKKLEVGGPEIMTIFQMAEKIYRKLGYSCLPIPLPIVKIGMEAAKLMPFSGIGKDQIRFLYLDNIIRSRKAEKYVKLKSFSEWLKTVKL